MAIRDHKQPQLLEQSSLVSGWAAKQCKEEERVIIRLATENSYDLDSGIYDCCSRVLSILDWAVTSVVSSVQTEFYGGKGSVLRIQPNAEKPPPESTIHIIRLL